MRRITANYLFDGEGGIYKNAVVEIDEKGTITNLIINSQKELPNTEFFNGVIVPGFVNTHSHLELAYMKGVLQPKTLPDFIDQIVTFYRTNNIDTHTKIQKSREADEQMYKNGIVAVGDIVNYEYTSVVKSQSKIFYHSFIELLDDFRHKKGEENLQKFFDFKDKFKKASPGCHSPYSCSLAYVRKLVSLLETDDIFSVHMLESEDENEFVKNGTGEFVSLFRKLKIETDIDLFAPTGKSVLESWLPLMPQDKNVLFVHNVAMTEQEVNAIAEYSERIYFSFCPKSNIYIQKRLPDFDRFKPVWDRCTIGTDSLASNDVLDILEEMKFINVPFSEKIKWATYNGAKALNISNLYGSIKKGKQPGINLITPFDFKNMELLPQSKVIRLV